MLIRIAAGRIGYNYLVTGRPVFKITKAAHALHQTKTLKSKIQLFIVNYPDIVTNFNPIYEVSSRLMMRVS